MLKSKYDAKVLENLLRDSFGETTLGNIKKPLIINATNVSTGKVHVFKSSYQKDRRNGDYFRDREVPLYKAVLASCAAPVYFDPVDIEGDLVCDGGLWANNPAVVGYVDAIRFPGNPYKYQNVIHRCGKAESILFPGILVGSVDRLEKGKNRDNAQPDSIC